MSNLQQSNIKGTEMLEIVKVEEKEFQLETLVSDQDGFGVTNTQLAIALDVSESTIREQKRTGNYVENVHYCNVSVADNPQKRTLWTKRGIIRLAFKMENTAQTEAIMDWCECYIVTGNQLPTTYISALEALVESEKAKEVALLKIKADTPKVKYAEAVVGTYNPVSIREWVNSLKSDRGLPVGERKVITFLLENKYLYRQGSRGDLRAYAKYDKQFSLIPVTYVTPKGPKEKFQLKITGLGQIEVSDTVLDNFRVDSNKEEVDDEWS